MTVCGMGEGRKMKVTVWKPFNYALGPPDPAARRRCDICETENSSYAVQFENRLERRFVSVPELLDAAYTVDAWWCRACTQHVVILLALST